MPLLVCTSERVLLPGANEPVAATISANVESGKIHSIVPGRLAQHDFPNDVFHDFGTKTILPGLVDAHVHLNEPGRTDWEGFWTGTRAAISGGVTTLVDMPLNSIPPTVSVADLNTKRKAAQNQCFTDVAFWGGVIPGNQAHLQPLVSAGVKGFKCFLIESGVEEFPCVSESDLEAAMSVLDAQASTNDTVLLFHAELDDPSVDLGERGKPTEYDTFLHSRPQKMESDAIALITRLQRSFPHLRCHIVHLSASSALPLIRAARASGLKLTVETCFHYLCLASEDIPNGQPQFKCCPPVREHANRDLLWDALKEGTIDCVVSDHSPCVAGLKHLDDGDIMAAWGGISTLGLGLSLLWTEGSKRGVSLGQIVDWTSIKTAAHAGLASRKGKLAEGYDADLVIWDPDAEFTVTKEMLNYKNKLSPYEGLKLRGAVEKVFLRGKLGYDSADGFDNISPSGILL